jgi:neutral ceramidase
MLKTGVHGATTMRRLIFLLLLQLLLVAANRLQAQPQTAPSHLLAAAAKVDITPPEGTPVVGHVREVRGVRDPICAVLLLLDDSRTKAAILTLDLSGAGGDMTPRLREAIGSAAGVPSENIMIAASHNHSGPGWSQNEAWSRMVERDIAAAAKKAAGQMRQVSIGYQEDAIDFNINRRQMIGGRSVVRLNPDGPCDHRVKVLRVDDGQSADPLAVVMHAVCHPCVFTWGDRWSQPFPGGYPKMSADFPGEAKAFVERAYDHKTTALFLQGCAGDIRPNLPGHPYRCGDESDIRWTGRSLGCAAIRAADKSAIREETAKRPSAFPIRCATSRVTLPAAKSGGTVECELQAMKIGPYLLLTMPGEPMVEYGLRLEAAIGERAVPIVIGYANGHIGYICTAQAFAEGGYEPNHSQSGEGAEEILIAELLKLSDRVIGDVFEAFAPVRR